jgi:hypothetical protein
MDFLKKILKIINDSVSKDGISHYVHESDDFIEQRVITVHANEDGMMVFSIFTPEQWSMVNDIAELSERDIEEVIREIIQENDIASITIDPKEF